MSSPADDAAGADPSVPVVHPAVQLHGITKRFGPIVACDSVDLTLERGRIQGILGENGAGKSTLMNILIGLVLPDGGHLELDGVRCQINDPIAAAELGIGMVHQHLSLVDALTVWENVALGEAVRLDRTEVIRRIAEIGEHYGIEIDHEARVGDLPAGLRQRVEIIKCLRRDPQVVIFDEPTSVLTPAESRTLFESFRSVVAAEGRAVVLVSHKLDEVLAATDDITIMRNGAVVERVLTADADAAGLARAMVGREVSLREERAALGVTLRDDPAEDDPAADDPAADDPDGGDPAADDPDGGGHEDGPAGTARAAPAGTGLGGRYPASAAPPVLQISEAVAHPVRGVRGLDGLSLRLGSSEILGIAGVEGNGQRVLADLLSSLVPLDHGSVTVDGAEVSTTAPGAMAKAGVGVIGEDRHDSGVIGDMSVEENLALIHPPAGRGIIDRAAMRAKAERLIDEFEIQCSGPEAPLWSLSGGNQQRVVLARELDQHPRVLVAAQPTRGLDVGAIEYMSRRLRSVADSGVAILLISSEIEEILELSDQIAVISRGRIVGEMQREDADLERLGLLMGGAAA